MTAATGAAVVASLAPGAMSAGAATAEADRPNAVRSASVKAAATSPGTVLMDARFSARRLDSKWQHFEARGCTSTSNVRLVNGHLLMRIENGRAEHPYCGARIGSTMLFRPNVYIEMRAKAQLPYGAHMGITLYGTKGLWPRYGEIDGGELIGRRPYYNHVRLWSQKAKATEPTRCGLAFDYEKPRTLDGTWHTYGIRWSSDRIVFSMDGKTAWTATYSALAKKGCTNPYADRRNPFRLYLSASAGGKWAGSPVGQRGYPATFDVDYVRVTRI